MVNLQRLRCLSLLEQGGLSFSQLKQVHAQLSINGHHNGSESASTIGKLIQSYSSISPTDGLDGARLLFRHTNNPDVFVWNVMIRCFPPQEGLQLFADGFASGGLVEFDEFTYIYVIGACARLLSSRVLWKGKQIHTRIIKTGFVSDVVVQTTCIHFYAKHEDCGSARKLFDEMPVRTSATWNAMITGYCSQKKRAQYHALEAVILFRELLRGNYAQPTDTTMFSVLPACSRIGDLLTGSCIHGHIEKMVSAPHDDVYIGTCLVEMYSKCGCLSSALSVFNRMKTKNILTWTSMMTGLAIHGQGKEALETLDAMQASGINPNAITFTNLLFACCHANLVEEGLYLFHSMRGKFSVTPRIQHYGCIVDLLGRAGQLQEAYDFITQMPIQPDLILWRSLLGACNIHGDVAMGEKVGKHLLLLRQERGEFEPVPRCEDFIALSNVYASAQRWEDLEMVRVKMKNSGVQIEPGSSAVQLV